MSAVPSVTPVCD